MHRVWGRIPHWRGDTKYAPPQFTLENSNGIARYLFTLFYHIQTVSADLEIQINRAFPNSIEVEESPIEVSGSFGVQMQANGQLNSLAFSLDSLQGRLAGEAALANDGIEINGIT